MAIEIIGHRGEGRTTANPFAEGKAPQHTLLSFENAIAKGADGIEFDVFVTRDLVPVIDATGNIFNHELAQLFNHAVRKISLPQGQHVPTLEEVLAIFSQAKSRNGKKLILNIELKGPSVVEPTLDVFRRALRTTSLGNEQVHFFSGDRDKVTLLRELDGDVQIQPSVRTMSAFDPDKIAMPGYFVGDGVPYSKGMISELASYLKANNCSGIDMPLMDIRKPMIDLAEDMGIGISTYPSGPRRIEALPLLSKNLRLLDEFARRGGEVHLKTDDIIVARSAMADPENLDQDKAERLMGMKFISGGVGCDYNS